MLRLSVEKENSNLNGAKHIVIFCILFFNVNFQLGHKQHANAIAEAITQTICEDMIHTAGKDRLKIIIFYYKIN